MYHVLINFCIVFKFKFDLNLKKTTFKKNKMSNNRFLNKQGYIIKKDQIDDKTLKEIKKELTVKPIVLKAYQDFVKPTEFEIFQESPNYLFLPRYYGIEKFGPPIKNQNLQKGLLNILFWINYATWLQHSPYF